MGLEALPKIPTVEELIIAIGAEVSGELLVIDAQGIAHLMEETSDGVRTDDNTEVTQRHGNLVGGSPGPLQPGEGIAGGNRAGVWKIFKSITFSCGATY